MVTGLTNAVRQRMVNHRLTLAANAQLGAPKGANFHQGVVPLNSPSLRVALLLLLLVAHKVTLHLLNSLGVQDSKSRQIADNVESKAEHHYTLDYAYEIVQHSPVLEIVVLSVLQVQQVARTGRIPEQAQILQIREAERQLREQQIQVVELQ